jgi:hypothetical protein
MNAPGRAEISWKKDEGGGGGIGEFLYEVDEMKIRFADGQTDGG